VVTGQTVALFIHLLGVVTLFIAIGIVQRGGARVRGSSTVPEIRLWLGLVRSTRAMFPSAFVFILGSGLYMTEQTWTFSTPWIVVAIVSILVMGILGGGVVGRGLAVMGRAATSTEEMSPDLTSLVTRPTTWVTAAVLNGMAIGLLWLMVAKPGTAQSIAVVSTLGAAGGIIGLVAVRRGIGTA
jgi:hypothetical protein